MAPILNAQGITKTFGAVPLLRNVGFTVSEGDRIGLIGPNGSGKSTLLAILAGEIEADRGEIAVRKHARVCCVSQQSNFAPGATVWSVLESSLRRGAVPEAEWEGRIHDTLGRAGFVDFSARAALLSGGWSKRLAIAEALAARPDVLLLDEPTNHLDLAGIEWLESLLKGATFAAVFVSHDRYFLENLATETVELNRAYPDGLLRVHGNYSKLLEKKEEFLAAQAKRQDALANRVRREIDWLRSGPKARTTKSKARIDRAQELIGELAEVAAGNHTTASSIDFSSTGRQSKRLIELENLTYGFGDRVLLRQVNFTVTAGMRIGLVGRNGSGKTTLLRLLEGEIAPLHGTVQRAGGLRTVYFDQRRHLEPEITLRRALAPDSDSVVYRDRVIHVAAWAARFLFTGEQLNQPVERLSGGERARLLIAGLMLEPADILLLDEPTNDLDIPTLEILEESLLEFRGALVLVTHDRSILDRVCTLVLGLNGEGSVERFADYSQWETRQKERGAPQAAINATPRKPPPASAPRKKLSYLEAREFAGIEERIAEAEAILARAQGLLIEPAAATDAGRLQEILRSVKEGQSAVDALYTRWAELSDKTV